MQRTDLMTWQAENVVGVRYVETLVYCAKQCYGWVDFGIAFFPPFLFFLFIFFLCFFFPLSLVCCPGVVIGLASYRRSPVSVAAGRDMACSSCGVKRELSE